MSLIHLRLKAQILHSIRAFFMQRQVLEVDVPALSHYGVSDPHLHNFETHWAVDNRPLYLQTSPEYALKRLLAQGVGDCYYLGKAFRNEACGPQHSPEFLMLEWYRIGFTPEQLMQEISELLQLVLDCPAPTTMRYDEALLQYANIDVWQLTDIELQQAYPVACQFDVSTMQRSDWLQLLFNYFVEPHIGLHAPCFITHFPADQAALAQLDNHDPRTAQRFECYFQGVELANGYGELTCAQEQARRFAKDNERRQVLGLSHMAADPRLIEALTQGLPECSGVALGVDRLVMLATGAQHIDDINGINFGQC